MSNNFDVVIVGNGILGKTTAYSLTKLNPELRIAVVGVTELKGAATKAAGAMLGHFGELTKYTLASKPGIAKFEISHQAARMWPQWIEQVNDDLKQKSKKPTLRRGTYVIHNAASGYLDTYNYLALKGALTKYKEPYDEVNPTDIPGLEPVPTQRPLGAIYLPNEGFVNPLDVLDSLEAILEESKNVSLIHDTVSKIDVEKIKTITISSSGDTIQAPVVLIAAGAFSQQLIDQIPQIRNRIPRLVFGAGCSVLLEYPETDSTNALNTVIRTINRAGACGLHVVPRCAGVHYIGATNNLTFAPETKLVAAHITFLLTSAFEQLNQHYHAGRIKEYFVGNRPVPLDTFPLIGETSIKGLWLLSGTYRDGFHLSPVLSQSIAREILGKKGLFENVFQPERRLIEIMTKEAAIEDAVMQYVSSSYEHGIRLPNNGLHETFMESNRKFVIDIYEKLECDYALPPEILFPYDGTDLNTHLNMLKQYLKNLDSSAEPGEPYGQSFQHAFALTK